MMHNRVMTNPTTQQAPRQHWLKGTTYPKIEAALRLHIIGGIPMRTAAKQAGCSLSGLRDAKRRHLTRIKASSGGTEAIR